MNRLIPVLAGLLGVGLTGNGIFMLASPETWYFAVPGVTSTGPFNQHFLRDIGLIFVLIGTGFLYGAARPDSRALLWSMAAICSQGMRYSTSGRLQWAFADRRCCPVTSLR